MINSGFAIYNATALGHYHRQLVEFGDEIKWGGLREQTLIADFFDRLSKQQPDSGLTILDGRQPLNWNPGWGVDPSAAIVHFHGPKPERCLNCFILEMIQGAEAHKKRWVAMSEAGKEPVLDDMVNQWMEKGKRCPWPDLPRGQVCPEIYLNLFKDGVKVDQGRGYVMAQLVRERENDK